MLFTTSRAGGPRLEKAIESMLEKRFGIPILVVIRSRDELAATITAAPADHGSTKLRSEVIFLKHPLTAEQAMAEVPELREGVDAIAPGPGALYFSRVAATRDQDAHPAVHGEAGLPADDDAHLEHAERLLELLDER